MMKLSSSRLLTLMALALSAFMITSCEKDKNDGGNSGMVQLLSFGPTGARHGDTIRFFGYNLNKVTAIQFSGTDATVQQADFKTQQSDLILLLVPQSAEKGYVTLKTPDGDILTKTEFNLNVLATITSMTLQARPGENITINGTFLNWIDRVTFARDKLVTTFVSQSMNQLVVKIPDDAETGPLVLHYTGTDSADIRTDDTLKVALPVATSFSPNPILHQTNLTITGTNLDLAKKVMFTGVSSPVTTFESQTATQLVIKVPASTRKGKLTFEAASGVKTVSDTELDVQLPAVTNMTPNPVDPGANLTVTGTNLNLVTSITFSNAPAVPSSAFFSQSATQIVVTVPMGVLRGNITLGVLNSTLTVQSPDVLEITGSAPPPTVNFPFYDDAVTSNWTSTGWVGGGWGGTADYNNTAPVRAGTKSVKITYSGGWGSPLQLGGANVPIGSWTSFKISIYGEAGSGGKKVNIGINGSDAYTITIVEGTWTDYDIPISTLTGASNLTEILVKEYNGSGGFTIYVDALGLN